MHCEEWKINMAQMPSTKVAAAALELRSVVNVSARLEVGAGARGKRQAGQQKHCGDKGQLKTVSKQWTEE